MWDRKVNLDFGVRVCCTPVNCVYPLNWSRKRLVTDPALLPNSAHPSFNDVLNSEFHIRNCKYISSRFSALLDFQGHLFRRKYSQTTFLHNNRITGWIREWRNTNNTRQSVRRTIQIGDNEDNKMTSVNTECLWRCFLVTVRWNECFRAARRTQLSKTNIEIDTKRRL